MKKKIALFSVLAALPIAAQAQTILTSIKPIQMITAEITQGVSEPQVLLNSNTSPHDYAMRPSDVKKVVDADLVIWFGHDLEPFMEKVLEKQPSVLTISDVDGLELREFGEEHDHHDHHGHDHGSHDPHFWLGYKPTLQAAEAIKDRLTKVDPENATAYQANYDAFVKQYADKKQQVTAQLAAVNQEGYFVFHDAYTYFEKDYGLNSLGHFTVSPERKPGAKTLIKIRTALAESKAKCVFSEPQFTPAVVESVVRGSDAKIGVLDPLGTNIDVKPGSYFEFIDQLSASFSDCLSK
ncbi:zinc ABC transporter substrate-binding protein ZnuA [Vibrio sp. LaRot3]|uniref:zinc ABC transporter substrate-binding protein ZnuA n=1 Tax=Vibrio sp. LaRot3 TaxID=2998829 RepID=UPI0022CE30B1|nr:zinc ABC transporter substrate-binding protein ZnuA [Vibrio sp. LaRot3]MDA0148040.1 zinc ABC transporter substrate-binding protein ZnuA [Vibrio sp. LaRot3]